MLSCGVADLALKLSVRFYFLVCLSSDQVIVCDLKKKKGNMDSYASDHLQSETPRDTLPNDSVPQYIQVVFFFSFFDKHIFV